MGRFDGRKSRRRPHPMEPVAIDAGTQSARALDRIADLMGLVVQGIIGDLNKTMHALDALVGKERTIGIFNEALKSLGMKGRATVDDVDDSKGASVRRGARKKKTVSPEGREAIRQAQLKRWAKIKAAKGKTARKK